MTNLTDSDSGSLRKVIGNASPGDTVNFQDGLSGTITLTSGPLTINKLLTIDGPGDSVITVNGNKKQEVFNILAPFTVTISGLTIANGSGTGAGISNGGALTIMDCTLSGNVASGAYGAGIFNTGSLKVTDCTFSGNSAGQAGGIFNQSNATLIVNNSTFSGNHGDLGGCIINNSATATVTDSTFSGNNSAAGYGAAGIYNEGNSALTVSNSTFTDNSAGSSGGGGILNSAGTLSVMSCTFSANSTSGAGGGINDTSSSNVMIASSTFATNAAVTGAGISYTGGATLTLISCTLNGNVASNQGGGVSHTGGGMLKIDNTIVAGNSAAVSSPDVMGTLTSQGYNLIGISAVNYSGTDIVGTAASPMDPLLGPLQDNGGPNLPDGHAPFTMALLPNSPALNHGDPAQLGQADQRGVVRSGGVNIGAYQASADAFEVGAPAQATASVPFDVTVTAVDKFGQVAIGYTGTVHFTSTDDPQATDPPDYTFTTSDNGMHTFPGGYTLITPGTQTVTITDLSSGITGNATITVTSPVSAAAQFMLSAPASATAGSPFDITVTAVDSNGNMVPGYTGTVIFTSTDTQPAVLPSSYTFTSNDQGMHTFAGGVTLFTAGAQTLTIQDTTTSSIAGNTTVKVLASAANHLGVNAPPTAIAGTPFGVTITAFDPYGNVDTAYTGTVTLTSLDRPPQPIVYAFSANDGGTHVFSTSLDTAGVQTLLAWDAANSSITGTTLITVDAASASQFLITAPSAVFAGVPFAVVVTALDPYGNTVTNYQGTVHFSSNTDPNAMLPTDYTFVAGDQGVHTFVGSFTLVTAGPQTLTAMDTANAAITGTATVTVQTGGGAGSPDSPITTPIVEPITPVATSGNVQSIQSVAAVDRLFAALTGEERRFELGWHTK